MNHLLAVAALLCFTTLAHAQQRPLKVLVLHDMEGLAGEDDWREFISSYPDLYAKGRQLLTDDVNAVIAGLVAGGATTIDVVDGHGSGNPQPDLLLDKLDRHAKMVERDKPFDPYVDLVAPGVYDAVALVGMHAKPGSKGFASHTATLGMELWMDGMSLSEPEINGYSWGRVNVPVIFVSGDDHLKEDLKTMPWIEYVVTKHATSASTVDLLPVDQVHAQMTESAKRALQNLSRMQPMKMAAPVQAALHARPPANLAFMDSVPGISYADNTVSFTAPDFGSAYAGLKKLMRGAANGYTSVLMEVIRKQPNGPELLRQYREALFTRWVDFESGRWLPPPPVPAEIQNAGRKFHGDSE
ncbi:MAG: M55 family metallopeptidase [Gemmatimonadetes bacterium]|nr:M55 family metallopeptidase [Gemmatimonadota bacterium]